jgi:hypothetical protein
MFERGMPEMEGDLMKIVGVSNYDDEKENDVLVASNLTMEKAKSMLNMINSEINPYGTYFYKIVPDDYKLHAFKE